MLTFRTISKFKIVKHFNQWAVNSITFPITYRSLKFSNLTKSQSLKEPVF